jgi:cytochrome P450
MSRAMPPGPRLFPSIRHLFAFDKDPLAFLTQLHRTYGEIASFTIAGTPIYAVFNPVDIEQLLTGHFKHYVKDRGTRVMTRVLGNGLLTSEGDFHRRQRQRVQPAFHHQRLQAYAETMVEATDRVHSRWIDGEVLDIHAEMMRAALFIVSKALLGGEVGDAEVHEIAQSLEVILGRFSIGRIPLIPLMSVLPLPTTFAFYRARAKVDAILSGIIQARRQRTIDTGDLLSMLLTSQDDERTAMTDAQLRDEMMTLFLAGHETTANALSWAWYLISQHPEVEARLHAEIDAALKGRRPTVADLPQLSYTRAIFAEAMRLFPPAWTVARETMTPVTMRDVAIPKGALVVASQWVVHRSPVYFEEPERFEPERFLADRKAKIPRFAYFPFGGGSRICVGEQFAWMEGTLVLARIAQFWRARIEPGRVVVPEPRVTLRPQGGMRVTLERRRTGLASVAA